MAAMGGMAAAEGEKRLVKEPRHLADVCEAAPLVYKGRLILLECVRPATGGKREDYYITLRDVKTGKLLARLAEGYSLASAIVHQGGVYVFASRWEETGWNDVTLFYSQDLKQWESQLALRQEPGEHLYNTSVCAIGNRFVMAYETDDPRYVPFTVKFAESKDLLHWKKVPEALFGPDRYAACPCLRYVDGYYYILYLEHKTPAWRFETFLARSRDLSQWELSPNNPILAPELGEDINTSDPDLIEFGGKVYLYYSIGDQRTYTKLKRAVFNGTLKEFLEWGFRAPEKEVPRPAAPVRYAPPDSVWKQTVVQAAYPESLPPLTPAQERFKNLKFGIFIHWGLYSVLGHGEWALFNEHLPIEDYDRLVEGFTAEALKASEWVRLAKRAGARYMNFVTKHHDGFCLFDSRLTDHTSVRSSPRRDFVAELSRACAARRMPLFLYYSLLDWHFPNFAPDSPGYTRYFYGQVEELATRYGPIAGFWFDMGALKGRYRGEATWEMIRKNQPEALIMPYDFFVSERTLTRTSTYDALGRVLDMPLPEAGPDAWPFEVCDTMNGSWGYNPSDMNYRSAEELIRELVTVVGRGGNLLLNISPTPSGGIPPEQVRRLEAIGDFLKRCGKAIYDTRPAVLPPQPWGFPLIKGNRLFLHILQAPDGALIVKGLDSPVSRVLTLERKGLSWTQDSDGLHLHVLPEFRDPVDTILEVVLKGAGR